jgi:arabinofuranan 3-O-arabinosyltransferase
VAGRRWGLRTIDDRILLAPAALLLLGAVVLSHRYYGGFDCFVYWRGLREFLDGGNPYANKDFVTPPSGLVALLPMRLGGFDAVYIGMQAVTTAALVGGLFVLLRRLLTMPAARALALSMAVVALSAPAYSTFALAIGASLDRDERATGLWLGVGLALKPVLVPFWLLFVIQRRWRAALWSFVPVVVGSAVAVVISTEALHFVDDGLPNIIGGLEERFRRFNITATAFADAARLPDIVGSAGRLGAAVATVAVAFLVWQRYQTGASRPTLEWIDAGAVLFIGTLLASAFAWRYYVVFLLPLFVLSLRPGALAHHPLVWAGFVLTAINDGLGPSDALPRLLAVGRYTLGVGLVLLGVALNALRADAAVVDEPVTQPPALR